MDMNYIFQSIMLGFGVASDAFAVATANGISHTKLKATKALFIALMFGIFQGLMPLIGYFIGRQLFCNLQTYISLVILSLMGIKMIFDALDKKNIIKVHSANNELSIGAILLQAIATSIDALSVGFAISNFSASMAVVSATIICLITLVTSFIGVFIGKKFGKELKSFAEIFGGIILIIIGIRIFIG